MATLTPALDVRIGDHRYPLHLGPGLLDAVGELWAERAAGRGVLLVADAGVPDLARRVRSRLEEAGFAVEAAEVASGEASKTLGELERLARVAARGRLGRADAVVALGGGVVGDLAGFLAASYGRGVRLVQLPTTLLAMVDAAVGGKTGVDLPEGKNLVGAIWQPELIVMDTDALASLPAAELAAGFAEVVKYGLLSGEELFARVEGWPALPGPADALTALIRDCVAHKLEVVAADERDLGRRATLNLGHTVGHGVEAAAGYRLRHGEAVGLGLLAALRLSSEELGCDPGWRARTAGVLARHGLPTRIGPQVATADVLRAMERDKKASDGRLNMVLLAAPGDVRLGEDPPRERVRAAIEELRRG